jgi:hypothetical protein
MFEYDPTTLYTSIYVNKNATRNKIQKKKIPPVLLVKHSYFTAALSLHPCNFG